MEKSISVLFRQRLKALRQQRGWTQEQAAEACGIGQKVYQHYELGIKANPGLMTLERIARGYGIGVHQLLGPTVPQIQRSARRSKR